MGRRRLHRPTLTTINISVDTAEIIARIKHSRETQDGFIRRLLAEWDDLKDYRLDMDQVIKVKDKQILTLENELREKIKSF
ncbi:MAG TPA: hypothetical protein VK250_02980 [Nitrososphaeraceae archaeon]|nr:hypothetical protein [Nitrososphaeraceae archaeon]